MNTLVFLAAFFIGAFTTAATSVPTDVVKLDAKRLVKIVGPITASDTATANRILKLAPAVSKVKADIDVLIDSPGGSIMHGAQIVQAIQSAQFRGYKIRCTVTNRAASMAFIILTYCSERYVLSSTMLLWHPPRAGVMGQLTPDQAAQLHKILKDIVRRFDAHAITVLGVTKEYYNRHRDIETWHVADVLQHEIDSKFFTIVKDIQGINTIF